MHKLLRVACSQYLVNSYSSWNDYKKLTRQRVETARNSGAQLILFPEYGSLELVSLLKTDSSLSQQLAELQNFHDDYVGLYKNLAQEFDCTIVAPTFPIGLRDGRFLNRAWLFSKNNASGFQDKIHMTRFEAELFGISSSQQLKLFKIENIYIGIAICYDVEFPIQVHALVEAGADIILVPSCTDNQWGFNRVKVSCQARAMENQCYVLQSPFIGEASWCAAIDRGVGVAGIYGPIDVGFSSTGLIAQGQEQDDNWLYADLNLKRLITVRSRGQVFNLKDWQVKYNPQVEIIELV